MSGTGGPDNSQTSHRPAWGLSASAPWNRRVDREALPALSRGLPLGTSLLGPVSDGLSGV